MLAQSNNIYAKYIIFLVKCNVGYNDYKEQITIKKSK